MKTRTKIFLLLVEGPSDETSLTKLMEVLCTNFNVRVQVQHGDITSNGRVNSQNIVKTVGSRIKDFIDRYHLKFSDVAAISLLIDTDGCFVPEESVRKREKFGYTESEIFSPEPEKIRERNKRKRTNINRLVKEKFIRKIPFNVLFMSRNLEHFIHGKMEDCSDEEKELLANEFERLVRRNPEEQVLRFRTELSVMGKTNKETWEFIARGQNSLHSHSNFCTLVELIEEDGSAPKSKGTTHF